MKTITQSKEPVMVKIINKDGLIEMLENFSKHSFCGLTTETTPKLLKKSRTTKEPLTAKNIIADNVRKYSEYVAGLGYEYQTLILNRLAKENKDADEYEKGESWHVPYEGKRTICIHKTSGELYAKVFLIANNKPKSAYFDVVTGTEISKTDLVDYLPVPSAPTNQGLEEGNEILVRTLKLNSIKKLTVDGIEYIVK